MEFISPYVRSEFSIYGQRQPMHIDDMVATPEEVDALLKVETEDDAIAFMEAYSPIYDDPDLDFQIDKCVKDILDTVALMRTILEGYTLLANGYSTSKAESLGFTFIYDVSDDSDSGSATDSLPNRVTCQRMHRINSLNLANDFREHEFVYDPAEGDYVAQRVDTLSGYAILGDLDDETCRAALEAWIDSMADRVLPGVKLASYNMSIKLEATDYAHYLWYEFMTRLFGNDIRRCQMCGDPFVANLNSKHERGANPKDYCNPRCTKAANKARKAVKLIRDGYDIEDAARIVSISLAKLNKYLELHPLDIEEVDNG